MTDRPTVDAALALLRKTLRAASYDQESLKRLLGIGYPDDIGTLNRVATILRLQGERSPLAIATRLFFLEVDESVASASKLLSRSGLALLTKIGLLRRTRDGVRTRLRIEPVGDQIFLADRRFLESDRSALGLGRFGKSSKHDPVYPPSADSIILRDAVVAAAGGSVLDLCTGSGVQAIARAPTASEIVAVDINPRAVAVARMNATLNQTANMDVRLGDLYAAVSGRRFDTIIANPPFVSSPYEHGPSYHAGGPTGDDLLRRILRGWTKHLQPNGRGFAITHVGLKVGQELAAVGRAWFRGFPGRAAVMELESGSPIDLAAAQAMFALDDGIDNYRREVDRWVAYLKRHRIARVAALLIVAEHTGTPAFEVVDAQARVLPLPLSPPPAQRVADWFTKR